MKRILHILLLCIAWVSVYAVPADEYWQQIRQPDGTIIELCLVGDEFERHYEDRQGNVYEQDAAGYWRKQDATISQQQIARRRQASPYAMRRQPGVINLAPRGIVILVNYSDVFFNDSNSLADMNEMLNGEHYDYDGATGSARQYFIDQSDGQYTPQFDVVGPVTLDKTRAYYGANSGSRLDVNAAQMVVDACKKADEAGVDFTLYDNDHDGTVDFVFILFADKGEADGGPAESIWPHNWNVRTGANKTCIVDGLYINNYACCAEKNGRNGKRTGIGTFCHEFGHVIGLPDYYDTRSGTNYSNRLTPRYWNIMDLGNYLNGSKTPAGYCAFDKFYLGWHTPVNLGSAEQVVNLLPINSPDVVTYQVTQSSQWVPARTEQTVYYIECRQKKGWDRYLPGHGMLVWKVQYNTSAWNTNTPNNTAYSPRFTLLSASGSTTGLGTANDPYPGGMEVTQKQLMTNRTLSDITETGDTVYFIFNRAPKTYTLTASALLSLDDHTADASPYYTLQGSFADIQGNLFTGKLWLKTNTYAGSYANIAFDLDNTYLETAGKHLAVTSASGKVSISGQNTYQTDIALTVDAYTAYRLVGNFEVIVPEPTQYTLAVSCSEGGSVTLLADGYTSKNNTGSYTEGTVVQLLPTPLSGWQFKAWSGEHAGQIRQQNGMYQLTMGQTDYSVHADFERQSCTVRTYTSPVGQGTIILKTGETVLSDGAEVPYKTVLTAEVVPQTNYRFDGWSDGETVNPRTLTVTGDTTLIALLTYVQPEPQYYTLTVQTDMGAVRLRAFNQEDQWNTATLLEGTVVILIPEAPVGYRFAGWSGQDADQVQTLNGIHTLTIPQRDLQLTALWEKKQFRVTAFASPADKGSVVVNTGGETLTAEQTVPYQTSIQLTATPADSYRFDNWNDGNTDNPRTIVVERDTTLTALFSYVVPEPEIHTVTVTDSEQGKVLLRAINTTDSVNHGTYIEGTTLLLIPVPATGYRFAGWQGADADFITRNNDTYTLVIGRQDYTVTPVWEQLTYPVFAVCNPEGTGEITLTAAGQVIPSGTSVTHGTTVSIQVTANRGWQWTGWNDGNTDNPRTVIVTEAVQLTAFMQRRNYSVTVTTTPAATGQIRLQANGTGIESGQQVPFETRVTASVTPERGWQLTAWSDGETANPRTIQVEQDTVLAAQMTRQRYTVTAVAQPNDKGSVHITADGQLIESGDAVEYERVVTLIAAPASSCHFTVWSDGETVNPRTVRVTGDTVFRAIFERDTVQRIILEENADDSFYDALAEYEDAHIRLVVLNRTIKANTYSTFCLPFDVPDITQTDLCGSVFQFVSATGDAVKGMTLNFTFAKEIKAGVPYIILATDTIVNPFFQNVTMRSLEVKPIRGREVDYIGTLRPSAFVNMGTAVAVFSNNKVYYPPKEGTLRVPAFRAYFYIPANSAGIIERIQILPSTDTPTD